MVTFFQQMARNVQAQPLVQPQTPVRYEKLVKYVTIEFKDTVDPFEVEQWLERMKRVFRKLQCTKALKFKYAVSLLQGNAYEW